MLFNITLKKGIRNIAEGRKMKLSEMDILLSHVDGIVITGNSRCCTNLPKTVGIERNDGIKKTYKKQVYVHIMNKGR